VLRAVWRRARGPPLQWLLPACCPRDV